MTQDLPEGSAVLLPNLGAEEGEDFAAYHAQPHVRAAAQLWCLLFGADARLWTPVESFRDPLWPLDLGPPAEKPAFDWMQNNAAAVSAWLNTAGAAKIANEVFGGVLTGAGPDVIAKVHDKAFAIECARELELDPAELLDAILILSPQDLEDPDAVVRRLDQRLAAWPEWTAGRFTLKPRSGSSGRGRVGGERSADTPGLRGALPRFRERGGAIFEPWLDRVADLSVALFVPGLNAAEPYPLLLGSLEMWNRPNGTYAGHCGEVDSRGRVFSGDPEDESLRADAALIAGRARQSGFEGPCGLDALRYRQPGEGPGSERMRLRRAVEFNARPTMGLVTIGLVRRALPRVRERLALTPGDRRGFALVYREDADFDAWRERVRSRLGPETPILDLSPDAGVQPQAELRPALVFAQSLDSLKEAKGELF